MYGQLLCCAHCLIRHVFCFLLKKPLPTWFHILHHRVGGVTIHALFLRSADFGVSPLNYVLLNSRHPSYQILATPLTLTITALLLTQYGTMKRRNCRETYTNVR